MKKTLLALSVASALCVGSAIAGEFEITPTIGGVMPEGNLGLDDQLSAGLRVGKNLENSYFSQVELALDYAPSVKIKYTDDKTDIFRGALNLVKDVPVLDKMSVYGLVGLGVETFSKHSYDNNDRMFVNYGAGLKYLLTDALALKLEARHAVKLNAASNDATQNNLLYTLGLAYSFGGTSVATQTPAKTTPASTKAAVGDDDGDGVANNIDECPNTPKGVAVDSKGCAVTIALHVNFNFDKADVLPQYETQIDQVANFMKKYPVYKVALEGYTDSIGSEAYNLKLSDKRSAAVANVLKNKGVEASRISTSGYGEAKPVADNKTKEGRAENRRVEAVFSY